MKRMKRTILVLAVLLVLISGAMTVYAVSGETQPQDMGRTAQALPTDYAAEEMAVEAYYLNAEI